MRILYLITGLRLGGAEKQLALIARHINQLGHNVLIVAMEAGGAIAAEIVNDGISVIELNVSGPGSLIKGYLKFRQTVSDFKPDLIHSHMIHANYMACFFKLFNRRYKLIITAHNTIEVSPRFMKGYLIMRNIPNWSTNVSEEAYEAFVKQGLFKRNRSSCIHNAIDTAQFSGEQYAAGIIRSELQISPDTYVYFSAGRLHHQKNFGMLLRAFKQVRQQYANSVLVIAGEGELAHELKQLSLALGIAEQVFFAGKRNDMPAMMAMSNCFVLSSNFEGFGLVIGEAMASGIPVIATDSGGVKEVMGGFGTLVQVGDAFAFATAMLQLAMQSYPSQYLHEARMHIIRNYDVKLIVDKWLQLYNSI